VAETATRKALAWFFRRSLGIYFREIEITGNLPPVETRGRVFVSNHNNLLLDPLLVLTTARCVISPVAKSTLWNNPALRWLMEQAAAVPIVRRRDDPAKQAGVNDEVFDKVATALGDGGNILIFPEGTSHNEPQLKEVRSGPARMLARAHARGVRGLTFQAVALEFEERTIFRTRCLIVYGPVRNVDELAAESGQALEGEALVAAITAKVREDLGELLVEGATWPERLLIARVAEMLTNDSGDRSLERWSTIGRQVEAAEKALRGGGASDVAAIRAAVERYYLRLDEEGLADVELAPGGDPSPGSTLETAALWLSLPLAAAGTMLYAIPYQVTRFAAARIAEGEDELSTYKLGVGLLAYPVWAAVLAGAGFVLLPPPAALGFGLVVVTSPFAALAWHDEAPRVRRAIRLATQALREATLASQALREATLASQALREATPATREGRLSELRTLRAEAIALIHATRDRLGMG
jgi:1-acyl-sn-glycerol-3-phosphate acyltransferase